MVSKFKMEASDLVSVRENSYIPTGIKGEMVRSGMDCHRKGQVIGTVGNRFYNIINSMSQHFVAENSSFPLNFYIMVQQQC